MLSTTNEYLESRVVNNLRRKISFTVICLGGLSWFDGISIEFKTLHKLTDYVPYKKYW